MASLRAGESLSFAITMRLRDRKAVDRRVAVLAKTGGHFEWQFGATPSKAQSATNRVQPDAGELRNVLLRPVE